MSTAKFFLFLFADSNLYLYLHPLTTSKHIEITNAGVPAGKFPKGMDSVNTRQAGVVELVDTLDLGSSAARCEGSSPFARTKSSSEMKGFFHFPLFIYPFL